MKDISKIDFSALDRPEVLMLLFHPRAEPGVSSVQTAESERRLPGRREIGIPVQKDVFVGARFHMARKSAGNILFFHGNGEIVADYDDLAAVYNRMGINFLAVDYRGYGRSGGKPSVTAMMRDCHIIFDFVYKWLQQNDFSGPVLLMGRSLGSASVLELAAEYRSMIDGLIVESGFAHAGPLLRLLGIDLASLGIADAAGFRNVDKIKNFDKPTLIIHAEFDHIIPFSDGRALYDACPSGNKKLLKIPDANHNDIFMHDPQQYLAAVREIVETAANPNLRDQPLK